MNTYKLLTIGGFVCSGISAAATFAGALIASKKASIEMANQVAKEVAKQLGK